MSNPLQNASIYLIQTLFSLYMTVVLARLLMQLVRANFHNPISQLVIVLTQSLLRPLRRFIPGYAGIDLAAVVLLVLLEFIKVILLCMLVIPIFPSVQGLLLWSAGDLLALLFNFYFYALFLQALLSWTGGGMQSPLGVTLYMLTEPLLARVRRVIPIVSGFDLSPLPIMIGLQLLLLLIAYPLSEWGKSLIAL